MGKNNNLFRDKKKSSKWDDDEYKDLARTGLMLGFGAIGLATGLAVIDEVFD